MMVRRRTRLGQTGVRNRDGAVAWLDYGMALIPEAIWFGRSWPSVAKGVGDALIYALLTAGAFGWLWPAAV